MDVDLHVLARNLWRVLFQYAGGDRNRWIGDDFAHWFETNDPKYSREFRFQGGLGFGGKFWRNNGRFYVTCYREDETPERLAMIKATNDALAAFSYPQEWS